MKRKILCIIFSMLTTYSIAALDCDSEPERAATFQKKGNTLIMNGTIGSSTPKKLKRALKKNKGITKIVMRCVPGSSDDRANLKAARMVRQHGLSTHVMTRGFIASGGTDFFLAGVRRTIGDDVFIGVHAWGTEDDEPTADKFPPGHNDHKKYLRYYKEMGIPSAFYWFTLKAAPADDMHNMTDAELKKYKILTD